MCVCVCVCVCVREREREREREGGREGERGGGGESFSITHRVVQSTVHFCCEYISHKLDGIIDHTMHLGNTAHRVGVLNTSTVLMALCETKGLL